MQNGLETIFDQTRAKLLNFLRLRGAGPEADDIVQEVWIRAAADAFGPIANPEAYLFRTAHNLMIDWHRSSTQRVRREEDWSEAHSGDMLEVDTRPDAEQSVISRSLLNKVIAEIDALGEPTCSIFRMFRIDATPQREIAAQMGISLPTVEKHLQRAYRRMAELKNELDMD